MSAPVRHPPVLIDTGYLIALASPDDALHEPAKRWRRLIGRVRALQIVTEYVLHETLNGLRGTRAKRTVGRRLVAELTDDPTCEVIAASGDLFDAGLGLFADRPDKQWSFTDCVSFRVMEQRGLTAALAHDRHFEQAGFDPLLRRGPPA